MWYNDALPYMIETLEEALYHNVPLDVVASGRGTLDIVERLCHPDIKFVICSEAVGQPCVRSRRGEWSPNPTLVTNVSGSHHVLLCS